MVNDKNHLYTLADVTKDRKTVNKILTQQQFSRFSISAATALNLASDVPPPVALQIQTKPQVGDPINDTIGSIGLITQIIFLDVFGSNYSTMTITDDVTFAFDKIPEGRHILFTLDMLIDKPADPRPIITLDPRVVNLPTLPSLTDGLRVILHFEGVADETNTRFVYIGGTVATGGAGGEFFGPWTADHDAGGFSLNNLLALDIEDSAGATKLSISGPLGVGGRLAFVSGDTLFFTENITDRLSISAAGLDVFSGDVIDVDRLQFIQDAGGLIAVGNPTIYVDSVGAGDLVINNVDTEAVIITHSNIIGLQETPTTLEKSTPKATATLTRIRQYLTGANPSLGVSIGDHLFAANRTTSGKTDYAILTGLAEDVSDAGFEGGFAIQIGKFSGSEVFMRFNDGKNDLVDLFKDIEMNNNDITTINAIAFTDAGGQIAGSAITPHMNFVLTGASTFRFTTNAENILDITDAGLIMLGTNDINLAGNKVDNVSILEFTDANVTISSTTNSMLFNVPDVGDDYIFTINTVASLVLEKFFADWGQTAQQYTTRTDPASPPAGDVFLYTKTGLGGFASVFQKQSDGTITDLAAAGAAGANTALSNLAAVAINTALLPNADGTLNIGSASFAWNDVYAERFRLELGGSVSNTVNTIIADAGGMILNTPDGDRFEFHMNGAAVMIAIEEDRIQFLTTGRTHRIDAAATSLNILAELVSDAVEIWTGSGRTNETMKVETLKTTFFTENNNTGAYVLQLIQNHDTPADGRTLANIDFIAEDSTSVDTIYARISASSQDITNTTEDGLLQLGVMSGGTLITAIDIEGSSSGGANDALIGFFGVTPVAQQTLAASPTTTQISTVLRALGLTKL